MTAKDFLEKNGFIWHDNLGRFRNSKCSVTVYHDYYDIMMFVGDFGELGHMCSTDLNIYWLIGVLTYHGLINKNYEQ